MKHYSDLPFLNVGTGEDDTIADFASEVARVVGYNGKIVFDSALGRPAAKAARRFENQKARLVS
jgi:nucleoside-diphosphate-sugar epimerase